VRKGALITTLANKMAQWTTVNAKGAKMLTKKHLISLVLALGAIFVLALATSCGEDPKLSQNEKLSFENLSAQDIALATQEENGKLSLEDGASSKYWGHPFFVQPLVLDPIRNSPYPLYDYYRHPVPVAVPVTPTASLIDFVHPFYARQLLSPSWHRFHRF
jgi:hypothetical protein